jgi:hypothetical protein
LRARSADIIPDADTKYHRLDSGWMLGLPRPQVPRGSIAGNKSAARAVPTGTAHAGLEREANPRQQIAARPDYLVAAAGGDAAAGSASAQGSPQQKKVFCHIADRELPGAGRTETLRTKKLR